jgi:hypothetical protein
VLDPGLGILHGAGIERASQRAADLLAPDEACLGEDAEVLQHGRERHRERRRDLACRPCAAVTQHVEDGAPRRVGESRERAVERWLLTVNHMV